MANAARPLAWCSDRQRRQSYVCRGGRLGGRSLGLYTNVWVAAAAAAVALVTTVAVAVALATVLQCKGQTRVG